MITLIHSIQPPIWRIVSFGIMRNFDHWCDCWTPDYRFQRYRARGRADIIVWNTNSVKTQADGYAISKKLFVLCQVQRWRATHLPGTLIAVVSMRRW